ncbi:hypothetical protein FPQ18DRAFT_303179 [Pyronema domesticum]|nr:hypothetical protein FPQ18DRAFT_303179 [Pyronema domesticum]
MTPKITAASKSTARQASKRPRFVTPEAGDFSIPGIIVLNPKTPTKQSARIAAEKRQKQSKALPALPAPLAAVPKPKKRPTPKKLRAAKPKPPVTLQRYPGYIFTHAQGAEDIVDFKGRLKMLYNQIQLVYLDPPATERREILDTVLPASLADSKGNLVRYNNSCHKQNLKLSMPRRFATPTYFSPKRRLASPITRWPKTPGNLGNSGR